MPCHPERQRNPHRRRQRCRQHRDLEGKQQRLPQGAHGVLAAGFVSSTGVNPLAARTALALGVKRYSRNRFAPFSPFAPLTTMAGYTIGLCHEGSALATTFTISPASSASV